MTRCEGPAWLSRPDTEHLDSQHEEDLARVVALIAAYRHNHNVPFGRFEPCLCGLQRDDENEAINNQQVRFVRSNSQVEAQQIEKVKRPEPVYLLAVRPLSFMVPLRTAVLRHFTKRM